MIGINKFTKEEIADLDPSDENDLYYQFDKRIFDFVEGHDRIIPAMITIIALENWGWEFRDIAIHEFSDLQGIFVSESGHLVKNFRTYTQE